MSGASSLFISFMTVWAVTCTPQNVAWNLPLKSPSLQCEEKGFIGRCLIAPEFTDTICQSLLCANLTTLKNGEQRFDSYSIGPALEETVCGSSSVCRDRKCTAIPKGAVPKYYSADHVEFCFK